MTHLMMVQIPTSRDESLRVFEQDFAQLSEHLDDPAHLEANLHAVMRLHGLFQHLSADDPDPPAHVRRFLDITAQFLRVHGCAMRPGDTITIPVEDGVAPAREVGYQISQSRGMAPDDLTLIPLPPE